MKKKYRRLFHKHDIHEYCLVKKVRPITGYDNTPQYIAGPWTITSNVDGSITRERDMIEVSTFYGKPIYGPETEVHNP